jgi:hypothetical protein
MLKLTKTDPSKVEAAARDVDALGFPNPLFDAETVVGDESAVAIHVDTLDGMLWIDNIRAFNHKDGAGSRLLAKIAAIADKHGVRVALFAVPLNVGPDKRKIPRAKLIAWYKRFGFRVVDTDYMIREPK